MNQFGETIRVLHSDSVKGYFSHCFYSFMHSNGIIHQYSSTKGIAERKHIVDAPLTLLPSANAPLKFMCVLIAVYLINQMSSFMWKCQVPHSLLYHMAPLYDVSLLSLIVLVLLMIYP